jgi:hypothetical protein
MCKKIVLIHIGDENLVFVGMETSSGFYYVSSGIIPDIEEEMSSSSSGLPQPET